MNKEFIPSDQALALKELGFDEDCLGWFEGPVLILGGTTSHDFNVITDTPIYKLRNIEYALAPLYQQAFRWFEETHSIFIDRRTDTSMNEILDIEYSVKSWKFAAGVISFDDPLDAFDREKAQLRCLKILIEIVKSI